jgi:hypothetical protein
MYTRLTPVTWEILYPNAEWNLHLEATKAGLRVHHDVIPWDEIEAARKVIAGGPGRGEQGKAWRRKT